jgi:hypothetical protein
MAVNTVEKAIEYLEKSLAIKETGQAYDYLSAIYIELTGDLAKADAAYKAIREKNLIGVNYGDVKEDDYKESGKRLRSALKKKKAAPLKPIVKTKLMLALESRLDQSVAALEEFAVPAELLSLINVTPADIRKAITALDGQKFIAACKAEIEDEFDGLEDLKSYDAWTLEWSPNGSQTNTSTSGYLSGKCKVKDKDNPVQEISTECDEELDGFEIGEVMNPWYDDLNEKFVKVKDEALVQNHFAVFNEYWDLCAAVFDNKLFVLVSQAYSLVKSKPKYLFLGHHEQDPFLVGNH